jgi:protein SCO1/2
MNESPFRHFLLLLCLGLGLAACGKAPPPEAPPLQGARVGGPFTLVDQDGRQVSDRDFAGNYRIVYFGFTYCPDVCPVDLQKIGQAMRVLEAKDPELAARVQPLFISVDPERDTPEVMKKYVAAFHPRIIGLTGTPAQVAAAAKAYAVYYSKRSDPGASDYLVDHMRATFLMGPEGQPLALLPHEGTPDAIAAEIERWAT